MHEVIRIGVELLEFLFAVGLVGSAVLVVLTSIEDMREVFAREDNAESEASRA